MGSGCLKRIVNNAKHANRRPGLSGAEGRGDIPQLQILTDQLTLSQLEGGGVDYPPSGFSDLPTALEVQYEL